MMPKQKVTQPLKWLTHDLSACMGRMDCMDRCVRGDFTHPNYCKKLKGRKASTFNVLAFLRLPPNRPWPVCLAVRAWPLFLYRLPPALRLY